jgi:hypothetical protein
LEYGNFKSLRPGNEENQEAHKNIHGKNEEMENMNKHKQQAKWQQKRRTPF